MSDPFVLSRYSSVGTKYVIDFKPNDPESTFYLEWRSMTPGERSALLSDCMGKGNKLDYEKFNQRLVTRCVSGWGGLTPRESQRIGLLPHSEQDLEAMEAQLSELNLTEIPWSKDHLLDLMANSDPFSERINDLAAELEKVEEARRAWKKKQSARMSGTGTSGDK